jgi:hypothetical protein
MTMAAAAAAAAHLGVLLEYFHGVKLGKSAV